MSFGDIFGSLKFALMGVVEARKGKFILVVDTEYVSVEDDKATPGPLFSDVTARFKTFNFNPEVGYRLYDDPDNRASVDVLGGIRVWHVSTKLDFGAGILPAFSLKVAATGWTQLSPCAARRMWPRRCSSPANLISAVAARSLPGMYLVALVTTSSQTLR